MVARLSAVVAFLVLVSGCSSSADSSDSPAPHAGDGRPAATARTTHAVDDDASDSADGASQDSAPALQSLPRRWSTVSWATPHGAVRAPARNAVLPDVLDGHGAPARLAYHAERLTDPQGWVGERVMFLGRDGQWRALDMADLGLPESWWPGPDSYGAGALSADGRTWAARTNAGVVFVDLTTGDHHHVAFPRTSPIVRYVTWVPGADVVSAYSRKAGGQRYTTFRLGPRGGPRPAAYDGSQNRFDVDGTPIEIQTTGHTLNLSRSVQVGPIARQWHLPVSFGRATPFGVFSDHEVALLQPTYADTDPETVWVFDKETGEALARLRVPIDSAIVGWTASGALMVMIPHRRLVTWDPTAGIFHRWLDVPPPYPPPGAYAASTVALPAR